ncbi:MAG: alpha/beta fold hydrolase [Chloroflexi bacterium CFX4]|nr:alpha/beta fold hydrolase [Chloroflexi bacterium CFX4]MDL1922959.1 alpha/beta fold hydrolase [Chloroflexi bacterium CFX3]
MSAITIENDLVHYEALGRGRPVILVHGWLGSWRYWVPTMQHLSGKYRAYAIDLWGFGDSGKDANKYAIKEQVSMLFKFFEGMGIRKAVLVGHSLGAAVCLNFARQYPEYTHRLLLISPPLVDMGGWGDELPANMQPRPTAPPKPADPVPNPPSPTNAPSTPASSAPNTPNTPSPQSTPNAQNAPSSPSLPKAPAAPTTPTAATPPPSSVQYSHTSETLAANPFRAAQQPPAAPVLPLSIATVPNTPAEPPSAPIAQGFAAILAALSAGKPPALLVKHAARDMPDLEMLRAEVTKADEAAFTRTAQSLSAQNLALELKRLMTPTLLLHGEDDTLLPPPSEMLIQRINRGKQNGYFLPLIEPTVGHFPMLEITAKFNRLLLDFLEATDLTNVQFKDQWKRTVR